jgi:hypothetical protein
MFKQFILKIDKVFFGKKLKKLYTNYITDRLLKRLESECGYKITSYYPKNMNCEVSRLCDLYGSDKGELRPNGHTYSWPSHTYADFYSQLFSHCRNNVKKVFECGLGTNNPNIPSTMGVFGKPGASLRMWRDYFPNATVYGADIDKDVLFQEERIKTYFVDQLNPATINELWNQVGVADFDFMVDDGLHTFEAGSTLFTHSIDKLAQNGIYIIEDVSVDELLRYLDFFKNKPFHVDCVCLFRPTIGLSEERNSLLAIRRKFN